ncbi:MAG: IPTL-CTERM sorting domain-containing protein [Lysobacterales bacterium]
MGQGASLSLGGGTLNVGCSDVSVQGSLDIGAGTLSGARNFSASGAVQGGTGTLAFSGNLSAAAALTPQSGTVRSEDGCNSTGSTLTGAHNFFSLIAQTDIGRSFVLPAGATQHIGSRLELTGGAARLVLRSTIPGMLALLDMPAAATWAVSRIDAQDVGMTPTSPYVAPQDPTNYGSIDRGNTPRLLGVDVDLTPIPALSTWGLLALMLGMLGIGMFTVRTNFEGKV